MEVIHPRCCGIDSHKESVVACLRLQQGRRGQTEVLRFGTTTGELLRLHERLAQAACTHVAMESTSVYWKPVFNLLEGSFEVVLANAHHIKAVPGRKTDVKDCEWIADLLAHGLIRASFIPPPPIRDLRDLTRHRKSLVRDRVKATNRVHKLLETANIKLAKPEGFSHGLHPQSGFRADFPALASSGESRCVGWNEVLDYLAKSAISRQPESLSLTATVSG